jgi:5-formyltetrahydrofolate cyclo-ligase
MRTTLLKIDGNPRPVLAAFGRWLFEHPEARTIAAYAALPGEVDLANVIARHPAIRWAFPRIRGERLTLHLVENPARGLLPGTFGILEPDHASPEIALAEIDAFACPGLAFDRGGGRLGRGRGFYDRLLASARPDAVKLGVCFPEQVVPDTFSEAHDVRMDAVISG